jgi:hypothetical protein
VPRRRRSVHFSFAAPFLDAQPAQYADLVLKGGKAMILDSQD